MIMSTLLSDLSLSIAELSELPAIWILGMPSVGVIVQIFDQTIGLTLLHITIVIVDLGHASGYLLPVAIAVPYLHPAILVSLLSGASLSIDNDLSDLRCDL